MGFYTIQNNLILTAENKKDLTRFYNNVLPLPDDYEQGKYIVESGELVLNPNWEEEQAELREQNFKSQFFQVENYGWYRKQPKGYQSAVESMNVACNIANAMQGIQAGLIIFYEQPDFTKPEECTEEWLEQHQIILPAMTLQEFMQLYIAFMTAWNTEMHENTEE